jgi:phosphoenolpyruvate-protein kinase (PTS system EI component)
MQQSVLYRNTKLKKQWKLEKYHPKQDKVIRSGTTIEIPSAIWYLAILSYLKLETVPADVRFIET